MLGNRKESDIAWTTGEGGVTVGGSVNISNQYNFFAGQPSNKQLPVISCAPSNENYGETTDFTAILRNKSGLVKFNTNVASSTVTLSNMYTQANVDFPTHTITPDESTGEISFATDENGEGWAILLPHVGAITATASAAGYNDASVTIPTINNNAYLSDGITVNLEAAFDPQATPLTFEAITADATVTFTKGAEVTLTNSVEYSLNGGAWTEYTWGTGIFLNNIGDKVSFRGNNAKYAKNADQFSYFSCDKDCYIYGNVMSLIDATNYATTTTMTSSNDKAFMYLFNDNTYIKNYCCPLN